MPFSVSARKRDVTFAVHVMPRGRRNEIVGLHGDALKVRVTAPPVGGAANEALCKFLAKVLSVPKGNIEIVAGQTSRAKIVAVSGILPDQVRKRLLSYG